MEPKNALARLLAGNERWVKGQLEHPSQTQSHRQEAASRQQTPLAVILGCSDSRVPPELIFDAGIGELFVVREAGNLADAGAVASIEYAVKHLGVKLVIVLGHTLCGAINAALEHRIEMHLAPLLEPIKKKVESARSLPGDPRTNASRANAYWVAEELKRSGVYLPKLHADGEIAILPALYDLDSGRVSMIEKQ